MVKELLRKNAPRRRHAEHRRPARSTWRNIKVPLLHIIAKYDHIVPPECARPLVDARGSRDKEEVMLPGGHVSLVAGPNAVKRMWPAARSMVGRAIA